MKRNSISAIAILLCMTSLLCFVCCGEKKIDKDDLWKNAAYVQDTEFGSGSKTVVVEVEVAGQSVKFTVHTDKDTVGAALIEHGLIDGDKDIYGLYMKVVNGITADYDVDGSYWAFYIDDEYAMTGIDGTDITEGARYRLVYTK